MASHFNIGEAKTKLSQLVTAAVAGEDVVLDRAGRPQVRLVPVEAAEQAENERRAAKRRSAIGMFRHLVGDRDIDVRRIKEEDAEYQQVIRRKHGDVD